MRFSNESPQLKQASPPLYRTRQPRYTSQHTSGHRQVVRHQLPKLTLAGSSPVARSIRISGTVTFRYRAFFNKVPGLEPARVRALNKREAFIASRRRRRQAPEAGADLRSKYADVPLPAPSAEVDFGNDRFDRFRSPRVSPDPGLSTAAGADLRSKYADVPLPAPIPKC